VAEDRRSGQLKRGEKWKLEKDLFLSIFSKTLKMSGSLGTEGEFELTIKNDFFKNNIYYFKRVLYVFKNNFKRVDSPPPLFLDKNLRCNKMVKFSREHLCVPGIVVFNIYYICFYIYSILHILTCLIHISIFILNSRKEKRGTERLSNLP